MRQVAAFCKKHAVRGLLGAMLLCLAVCAGWQLWRLGQCTTGWSLRYDTPISGQVADAARCYSVEKSEKGLWPSFWREGRLVLESEMKQQETRCLQYSGEGALVWPARFVRGGWPGATDEAGCVVSTALAWQLWGSEEVLGKSVRIDGKDYIVRGVMEEETSLCLFQTTDVNTDTGWQAVEFHAVPGLDKDDVVAFARASGLGEAEVCLSGGSVMALGIAMAAAPPAVLLCAMLVVGCVRLGRRRPVVSKILLVLLAGLLAVALPGLLGLLPGWAVPAKWSDLSHWGALLGRLSAFVEVLVGMAAALRDVVLRKALLALLACACAGGPLLLWFAFGTRAK